MFVYIFYLHTILNPRFFRCSSGNTDSIKEKLTSIRVKKGHLVALPGLNADEKSSSESLTFGKLHTLLKTSCTYTIKNNSKVNS